MRAIKIERDTRKGALAGIRICDLSGQLAGAGATRFLAAFGAQVIRVEDPTNQGRWDILRGAPPFKDDREGTNLGGPFNNHNIEKLGVTINLRTPRGREILKSVIAASDVVTENFSAGVMTRLGFGYERLREIRPDIVYVSNSGFGHTGPYKAYKTFGPIVQALSGLTFASGIADQPPAGWGYSYMDHMGGNFMALAVLAGLVHRNRTGEGQWVDMSCTEAGLTLAGPSLLDFTVNQRPLRRPGSPDSNHSEWGSMAPHNIYPADGSDTWLAIACRNDEEWRRMAAVIGENWADDARYADLAGRLAAQDDLDAQIAAWTGRRRREETVVALQHAGVPAAIVATPQDRIDNDPATTEWGLWPTVRHSEIGTVRVDGVPVHMSETDWQIENGAPCLGEHNELVFGQILGLDPIDVKALAAEGII